MNTPLPTPTAIHLHPDPSRVLIRAFISADRAARLRIIERALMPDDDEITTRLAELHALFDVRHHAIEASWRRAYCQIRDQVPHEPSISDNRRLYIGALFSGEYALESTALFNPSIVQHPDQSGLEPGALRFILSLRATGEGHISSIAFRSGILSPNHEISIDPVSRHVSAPELNPDPTFRRSTFFRKLHEMEFDNAWSRLLMNSLGEVFTRSQLNAAIRAADSATPPVTMDSRRTKEGIRWLAEVNYQAHFETSIPLSRRIIFPVSPTESNGMEDARFVRFKDEDGTITYYATYTAYNGRSILPQLLETTDFANFRASTLNGPGVRNKGMALFSRKINGRFFMISREDDENLYLMHSEDLHFWEEARLLRRPTKNWESVKIGNCGSPIETSSGWLLITHGVGPMRRYCIGALLLDLENPSIVIGHLAHPLIEPDEPQRDGYVPNVVYTCGALIHGDRLILPYALNDTSTTIVTFDLQELLSALTAGVK
ncbi:MAG: glycoside hydrolase family 130 protein [Armatimonadetes bacterium]|nr:glycoside hydrolase family 130 protein [Akkermansiaceae bacterium]